MEPCGRLRLNRCVEDETADMDGEALLKMVGLTSAHFDKANPNVARSSTRARDLLFELRVPPHVVSVDRHA